ncbi:hypothetical protein [Dactylosporangium sp. CA-233914]|uniref:hypothetical protein n=1 Tax=Dactylosporangium sp. CA-233914 TaxID=3239934 RepID=UPI003D8DA563
MDHLWGLLPDDVRARVDEELAAGNGVRPIQLVRDSIRLKRDDCDLEEKPDLAACRQTVQWRRELLESDGSLPPFAAADLPAVLARARLMSAPIEAIEARQVGEYIRLFAVVRRPERDEVPLVALPDAEPGEAAQIGAGLSAELVVPLRWHV